MTTKQDLMNQIQYVFDYNEPGYEPDLYQLRELFLAIVEALPEPEGDGEEE